MNNKVSQHNLIIPRISQLDAVEFDDSIRTLLSGQVLEVGKFLKPGLLNPVEPELQLLVDCLVLKNSILRNSATFGQQLLDLRYLSKLTKGQLYLYALINVLLPYIKRRYDESLRSGSKSVRSAVDGLWNVGKLIHLLNLLLFLREGLYPTVVDRLLGLKYTSEKRLTRNVGYNYIARELLWHGFMELLMFTVPLVSVTSAKRLIKSIFSPPSSKTKVPPPTLDTRSKCSVCRFHLTTPCRISLYCSHVACYFCLKGSIMADEKFCCPDCGVENTAVIHFQYVTVSS